MRNAATRLMIECISGNLACANHNIIAAGGLDL